MYEDDYTIFFSIQSVISFFPMIRGVTNERFFLYRGVRRSALRGGRRSLSFCREGPR